MARPPRLQSRTIEARLALGVTARVQLSLLAVEVVAALLVARLVVTGLTRPGERIVPAGR
jgi:hypothetical protein